MKFSQMLMQAASYTKSSLLQLPHILPEHLRYFASKKVISTVLLDSKSCPIEYSST